MSFNWYNFLRVVALSKALVAGAGFGLAVMGAFDIAFAVAATEWWNAMKPDYLVNVAAATGALGGLVVRVLT